MIRKSTGTVFKTLILSKGQWNRKMPVRNLSAGANPLVTVDVDGKSGIAVVTMNRRPVNGISLELLEALSNTLDDLESNKSRGVILTSVRQLMMLVVYCLLHI